ncbi:LysE family translocator [Spiribacter insolitus]|uniref:LysE family translocator n=1 Tax=Spiribacter insolitus TaxID=3122417 RepID=A0ABV3T8Q9_9GAMM
MTFAAWLSLLAICLLGALSPGPSLAVVIRNTVNRGRGAGITTALSHGMGVGGYALATSLGLATVIAAQQALFNAITLAGSAYLLWLGASAMRGGRAAGSDGRPVPPGPGPDAGRQPAGGIAAARDGFTIAFLNPKIALFFLALFSQFVSADAGVVEVAILAGTATVVDAGWYALVAIGLTATGTTTWLRRHGVWIERITGAALVFLALSTAASTL